VAPPPVVVTPPPASQATATPADPQKAAERKHPDRKPKKEPRVEAAGPPGKVKFMIRPWGEVEVDGKVIGLTPLPVMELPSGPHKIVIRNSELGKSVTKNVTVGAGKQTDVRHDFE
jgi:serine/threonine-protein kinase